MSVVRTHLSVMPDCFMIFSDLEERDFDELYDLAARDLEYVAFSPSSIPTLSLTFLNLQL